MTRQLLLAIALVYSVTGSYAQNTGGTFSGKVTDRAGAGIPNATVTLTSITSNASQKATTGSDGTFTVPNVAAGDYRIDIERPGFRRSAQQTVQVGAGPSSINVTLQISSLNETIEVTGQSPSIQLESGDIS